MIVVACLEAPAPSRASRTALDLAAALASQAQVIALCAGGPPGSPSLALAASCAAVSRVLHIDDPVLAGADVLTLGSVLAQAVRFLGAGLVVAGDRSEDEGQGLVPAALAHHWGVPLLSRVQAVALPEVDTVQVTVRSGGQLATLSCVPPLVLSTPPAAAIRELTMGASRAPEALPLAQLGLDASRLVPRPDLVGTLVPGTAELAAAMTWEEFPSALTRHR